MGEHPAHVVLAVRGPLLAVVVDVGPERCRNRAGRPDAPEQIRIHQRAVLDAMPAVRMRPEFQYALVGIEHLIDRDVTVRMNADLPAVTMRILDDLMSLLLVHDLDAVVVRLARIRLAHAHRAFGRRTVRDELGAADTHELVAEPGADAAVAQLLVCIEAVAVETDCHDVSTMQQLASCEQRLIGRDLVRLRAGIVNRRQPARDELLRLIHHRGLTALALLLRRERLDLADALELRQCEIADLPLQLALLVVPEAAAGRIRRVLGDPRELEGFAVQEAGVAAAVHDDHRMIGHRRVEILATQQPLFLDLGVVELERVDPVARWRLRSTLAQRVLDFFDRAQIGVDVVELLLPARMAVRVDESRRHGHALAVDDLRLLAGKIADVGAAADCDEPSVFDCESFGTRHPVIDRQHVAVDDDQIRRVIRLAATARQRLRAREYGRC